MTGGSTNAVLHLLAVANDAGVDLTIDDFDRISWRTPLLADLKPFGRFVAPDMFRAGGVRVVASRLREAGLLNEGAVTVTGTTIGEEADAAEEADGQEVIRPLSDPLKPNGGLAILRGNLAPDGCVVKLSGHGRHGAQRPGARVRVRGGGLRRGRGAADPAERRRRDPQRGPVGRPRHARDARRHRRDRRPGPRRLGGAPDRRPLLRRDARLHGRPRRAGGAARRPDRRRPRRRHGRLRRAEPRAARRALRRRDREARGRLRAAGAEVHDAACSASTRSTSAPRPKAPSRPRPRLPAPRGRSPRRRRGPRSAPRAAR